MKKLILFAAILFAGVSVVKADGTKTLSNTTGDATLQVHLTPLHILEVSQDVVVIEYKSLEDYSGGASSDEQADHLKVTSTGGFSITAKAEDLVNTGDDTKLIGASKISINAKKGTNNGFVATGEIASLSNEVQTLINSTTSGALSKTFNVTYHGKSLTDYLNSENSYGISTDGAASKIFQTKVTYTLVPN